MEYVLWVAIVRVTTVVGTVQDVAVVVCVNPPVPVTVQEVFTPPAFQVSVVGLPLRTRLGFAVRVAVTVPVHAAGDVTVTYGQVADALVGVACTLIPYVPADENVRVAVLPEPNPPPSGAVQMYGEVAPLLGVPV